MKLIEHSENKGFEQIPFGVLAAKLMTAVKMPATIMRLSLSVAWEIVLFDGT